MGGFDLTGENLRIRLPLSAQRLLAFLALNQRPLLRGYVAGMLWLDASEDRSHGSLRTALWRLRRPGHDLVELGRDTINISAHVAVDISEMAHVARRLAGGDHPVSSEELHQLASGGDLLPGWYEDWVVFERERTRQIRLQALETAAEQLARSGRFAQAVVAGLAAVEGDPLRESAHRALIRAHLASGNRSEALRQYRLYVRALKKELGLEPSPDIDDLMRTCRAR